jgi:hypothetical protein
MKPNQQLRIREETIQLSPEGANHLLKNRDCPSLGVLSENPLGIYRQLASASLQG